MERLFKVCKKCGTVCHEEINSCPALKRRSLDICGSSEFRPLTAGEFGKIRNSKVSFYFEKWPEEILPTPKS